MKCMMRVFLGLLLLAVPVTVQAQFTYTTNADNTLTITGYTGGGGNVTIPTNLNGLTVTIIGSNAFQSSTNLTSITIPACVTSLEDQAFSSCPNLADAIMSYGVTNVGSGEFFGCYNLTNLTIPASVTSIGEEAFLGTGLTSVTIPGGVTNIPQFAFDFCMNLTNVAVSYGVISIEQEAFGECTSLLSVSLPASLTSISNSAFDGCTNLTSVTIPRSVTNISDAAFSGCVSLTNVIFLSNPPSVGSTAFLSDTNTTVYYLPGTVGWTSNFAGCPAVLWNPTIQTNAGRFGISNNQFGFNVTGTTNIPVVVQACTNLTDPIWTPLMNLNLTNGSFYFSDSQWSNYPCRFYSLSFP